MSRAIYDHRAVEKKWQDTWLAKKIYQPDINKSKNKFYNLWMFPYPSAEGLHAGHAFASTGSDVYGRFKRMNGYLVFQPIGYDSFGIHSENFALKVGDHPKTVTQKTTKNYERQMKSLGHGYDWGRTVTTSDIDYYRWTQWLFIQLFNKKLAYRKKASVNWCPSDKTVLADEQVINGKCERCQAAVEKKELEQWFLKITAYADQLLANLDKLAWPAKIKTAQRNWIGKSEGMYISFKLEEGGEIKVFTTRPDTLESATFIATSDKKKKADVDLTKEKLGKFTGKYAINPVNNEKLPIWETNYVEESYGTGSIMGVPAYDERDMEFARKYHLDVVKRKLNKKLWEAIGEKGWGVKTKIYHLRDWLISRQRYWGPPIPMIFCEKCGWQPVPEAQLPVFLPELVDYQPTGSGKGPLDSHPEFYKTACPVCGGQARRETDVSDTFLDSSWYFLRYPTVGLPDADKAAFDPKITQQWLPVDLYFGGAEHAVLHLMYARFISMVLHDLGYVGWDEPFSKFYAHGLMIKDGAKMSKSRGNVVNPDQYIEKFGADTLRLYLMFMGPMDGYPDFRDTGIEGMRRFVDRLWKLFNQKPRTQIDAALTIKMHQTILKVTEDLAEFKYNTAIAAIMEFVNLIYEKGANKEVLIVLTKLIAPLAPHLAEEVWVEILGQPFSIHNSTWPKYASKYIKIDQINVIIQVNGRVRTTLKVKTEEAEDKERLIKSAETDPKIAKWLKGKKIKKTVFVPGKLINFVV